MQELALRVATEDVEAALDVLWPLAPHGVHEVPCPGGVELRIRGAELEAAELGAALGLEVRSRRVPDDWAAIRRLDRAPARAGRIAVRAEWMAAPAAGTTDVVVPDTAAFGTGDHPTTRMCLELLAGLEPSGPFADLGCGSGVLAAAAAALGFEPVTAVDGDPGAVTAARATAAATGVEVAVIASDLRNDPPPAARVAAANVPEALHASLAPRLRASVVLVSGLRPDAAGEVLSAYAAGGFAIAERREESGWFAAQLIR